MITSEQAISDTNNPEHWEQFLDPVLEPQMGKIAMNGAVKVPADSAVNEASEVIHEQQIITGAIERYAKRVLNGGRLDLPEDRTYSNRHKPPIEYGINVENEEKLERDICIISDAFLGEDEHSVDESMSFYTRRLASKYGVHRVTIEAVLETFRVEMAKEYLTGEARTYAISGIMPSPRVYFAPDKYRSEFALFAKSIGLQVKEPFTQRGVSTGVEIAFPSSYGVEAIDSGEASKGNGYLKFKIPEHFDEIIDI